MPRSKLLPPQTPAAPAPRSADTVLVHFNHTGRRGRVGWPEPGSAGWWPNYGDMLVCAALLRMVWTGTVLRVNFGDPKPVRGKRALIRGSTYLHGQFDFAGACRTLDQIDAPLVMLGLGAQHPVADPRFLDGHAGARDFIARLNERGASISVRGAFTAEVVARLGGRDIRVTGCPSLFYSRRRPEIRPPEMLQRPERRLGLSLHSGLTGNLYCRAPEAALRRHGEAIGFALRNAATLALFEQGVPQEYRAADRALGFGARVAAAEAVAARISGGIGGGAAGITPYDLIARLARVTSIEDWLARAADLDAIFGFRFHGNMVALLQGLPCLHYVYDSRIAEFCTLYGLPAQDVEEEFRDPVAMMLAHDWDGTNRRIAATWEEMQAFLSENGLESRLR